MPVFQAEWFLLLRRGVHNDPAVVKDGQLQHLSIFDRAYIQDKHVSDCDSCYVSRWITETSVVLETFKSFLEAKSCDKAGGGREEGPKW